MSPSRFLKTLCVALPLVWSADGAMAQCGANAGADVSICGGGPQQLNGSASGPNGPFTYSWSPATGLSDPAIANPVCTATTTTTYTLTVTPSSGPACTDQVTVTVNPTPNAAMTTTGPEQVTTFGGLTTFSICDPSNSWQFSFADQSAAFPGSNRTLNWGDGSPVVNPAQGWSMNHTYNQGLYTVTYTITYPNGCSNAQQYYVFLGTNPGGGISTDPNTNICTGGTLPFYINSVAANSPGTTYIIDFGDGQTMNLTHPPPAVVNHTYTTTTCGLPGGQLNVYFTAQNPCDQTQGQIGPIRVSETPQAAMTLSPNDTTCVGSTVTFTDQSTGATAPACNTAPRNIWTITPAAGWTVTAGTLGNNNGNPANPGLWTDGSTALSVQFTVPGSYTISDQTGNSCGMSTISRTICVEAPPVPAFTLTPSVGCAPFAPVNVNTTTSANSCLVTYEWTVTSTASSCGAAPAWNFSSGTSTSLTPQFLFTQPGTYTVRFRAINSCNVPPVTQVITVNAPPTVDVQSLSGICAGQCVNPTAVVTDCGSPITTYAWSFPGGSPANAATASPGQVCFANPTSSSITLTATNACGSATDATTLGVGTLPPVPVVASNSPVCAGQTLSLSATPVPGVTFSWSGPNGFSSNQSSVTINNVTAANAGNYTVVAISGGCQGPPAQVNVQVVAAPVVSVNPSSAAICNGQSTTLTASGAGNYQWFIGATQVGSGPNFTTSPAATTTYTVSGSTGGCPGNTTVTVTVYPLPNVNAGIDQFFCDQAIPVNLTGSPSPGTWSGTGVTPAGVFTPTPGDQGVFTLTYSHTNANGCTSTDNVDITVGPVTQFADAGPDTSLCLGNVPVILPASPPGGTWVGAGPGGAFTPSTVGNFTVTYNFGSGTCATSDQMEVSVLPAPILNLPADINVCADAAVIALVATPVGGVWTGAGVSGPPYQFDPAAVAPGPHTLTFTYSDGSGCQAVGQITATVDPLPVPNAGADIQLCDQPIPYQFTGSPAGGTWTSDWMTVTAGGELTPSGAGTDTLTYTITTAAGCTASDDVVVEVVTIAEPAFAGNDTSVCVSGTQLQLNATPVGGTWTGPQVTGTGGLDLSVPGSYTLTYSVGSATCLLIDQVEVNVQALPVVDAGGDIGVCLDGGPQQLVAAPAGGLWSGTGVDPTTGEFDPLLAVPGGTQVTYTYTDPITGCTNADNATVTVHPLPVAAFVNDPIACANVPFQFNNSSTGASGSQWDFDDNSTSVLDSPSHTFTAPGTYNVRLVAGTGAGCTDTTYATVTVWDVPQTAIVLSGDTGCGPFEVDFVNNSAGEGLSYVWDFGGLGSSLLQDPPPFFFPADPVDAITYDVSLTATNVCGSDVAMAQVTVIPSPTAIFGPNVNVHCAYADVPFGNASIGLPESFWWDFGDGATSTLPGPVVTHAYDPNVDAVDYTVTLVATNACGSDTAQQVITIVPNEVTSFFNTDPVIGCGPLTVNFTQYSAGDTAWFWDLGDGNTSIDHDPTHTYVNSGTYTIELSSFGCGFDQYSVDVTVLPYPVVDFISTPQVVCVGEAFTFTNQTPNSAGVSWDFGDGTGSPLSIVQHTYDQSGTYNVALTVTSVLNGCSATLVQPVTVAPTPVADFTPDPGFGCIDLDVAFQNNSATANFYQWDFGDGNTSGLSAPFHTYTVPGTYTVTLVAESVNGCTDTLSVPVVAHPLPVSSFTLSSYQSCTAPVTVQTINASQGAIGYEWDLGNGSTSQLNQPTATFDQPGSYTVSLTATNQFGCTHESSNTFIVHPTPLAAFTSSPQPGCDGYPITFTNTSLNSFTYQWWLGDGTTSATNEPLHTYPGPGVYDITLVATGAGGCTDTLIAPGAVVINVTPIADFTSDTLLTLENALQFTNLSLGATSYEWDFDDGERVTVTHPIHLFPADGGGYTVCLAAANAFSCVDTICKFVLVGADPIVFVPNTFTPNGDGLNDVFHPVLNGYDDWNYKLLIFDRWGEVIHQNTDRNSGWDGKARGTDSQIDVYVWKVVVEREGDARDFIGHVSLVR